jgi:hypothetical protein
MRWILRDWALSHKASGDYSSLYLRMDREWPDDPEQFGPSHIGRKPKGLAHAYAKNIVGLMPVLIFEIPGIVGFWSVLWPLGGCLKMTSYLDQR